MPSFGKLAQEQQSYQTTGVLLALEWINKRGVQMLTTLHGPFMVEARKNDGETGQKIKKPLCITQNNKNAKAVDQVDLQNSFSQCLRKTIKWYRKLFFHLLDITVQNSCTIFKMKNDKNLKLSEFRLELARKLIEEYGSKRLQMRARSSTDSQIRLTARHFIAFIPRDKVQMQPSEKKTK